VKITTPEEAMEYLKQSREAPPVRISESEEPRAWFEQTGPYGGRNENIDRYMEYTIRWSGTPYGKYDWVGFYMMEDVVIAPDEPWPLNLPRDLPIQTKPDGTQYVTLPGDTRSIFWQWASNGSYYENGPERIGPYYGPERIGLPGVTDLSPEDGDVVPLGENRHGPYVRYYFWDYISGRYMYSSEQGVPAGA
jgi:hypothetical protein